MPSIIKPYTLLAAIVALNASGQSLSKEITVDKDGAAGARGITYGAHPKLCYRPSSRSR